MMVSPHDLDVTALPWLPLEEKTAFPKRPSIYFAIDSLGNVQYVGRSINVRNRWGRHHKYETLSKIGGIKIAYLFVDDPVLLPDIEKALIQWFQPPLNIVDNPSRSSTNLTSTVEYGVEELFRGEAVTQRSDNARLIKVFVTPEEHSLLKPLCGERGGMSHVARMLLVQWASEIVGSQLDNQQANQKSDE